MKHLGYIADADGILLWFPSQNRTFSVPKPYVFGSKTVRFWDGERKRIKSKQFLRNLQLNSVSIYTKF